MTMRCHGRTHCHSVRCERCAWRKSRQITRRISASANGPIYAVVISIPDASPFGFRQWRVEMRNRITYLRNAPRWRDLGLHVWRCEDRKLRGVMSLGALGPEEVQDSLSRWPMVLRPIQLDDLRI